MILEILISWAEAPGNHPQVVEDDVVLLRSNRRERVHVPQHDHAGRETCRIGLLKNHRAVDLPRDFLPTCATSTSTHCPLGAPATSTAAW